MDGCAGFFRVVVQTDWLLAREVQDDVFNGTGVLLGHQVAAAVGDGGHGGH